MTAHLYDFVSSIAYLRNFSGEVVEERAVEVVWRWSGHGQPERIPIPDGMAYEPEVIDAYLMTIIEERGWDMPWARS